MGGGFCNANYPPHWKEDKNFPLVFGKQGMAWYLDKSSIIIKTVDPPYYVIAAKVIYVDFFNPNSPNYGKKAGSSEELEFFYDEEEYDMKIKNSDSDWFSLRPIRSYAEGGRSQIAIGEALFYIYQKRKFYGDFKWLDPNDKENLSYFEEFPDEFYDGL